MMPSMRSSTWGVRPAAIVWIVLAAIISSSCGSKDARRSARPDAEGGAGGDVPLPPTVEAGNGGAGPTSTVEAGNSAGGEVRAPVQEAGAGGVDSLLTPPAAEGGSGGAPPLEPPCELDPCNVDAVWSGTATIVTCEAICSSSPGSIFSRRVTLVGDGDRTFHGSYDENDVPFATLSGSWSGAQMRFDWEYIDTGSYGSCEGSAIGNDLTLDCVQILGDEYGADAGKVNSTYTEVLSRNATL